MGNQNNSCRQNFPDARVNNLGPYAFLFACKIILFIFFSMVAGVGILALGMPSHPVVLMAFVLPASSFLSGAFFHKMIKKPICWWLVMESFFFVVLLVSAVLMSFFYDNSYDGMGYHQEAVLQIESGWNPVRDIDGFRATGSALYMPWTNELWVEHYPKGWWFVQAFIVSMLGKIESGKVLNLWVFMASLSAAIAVFQEYHPRSIWLASALLAVAILNPVTVTQMCTYYVDGAIGSLVLFGFCCIILMSRSKSIRIPATVALLSVAIILTNMKFTGLLFASMLLVITIPVVWGSADSRRAALQTLAFGALVFSLGVVFVGFNPYVTNVMNHNNLFYPIVGNTRSAMLPAPDGFLRKSNAKKLIESLFARSGQSSQGMPSIKFPGAVTYAEISAFGIDSYDVGYGGFGPLYSLCLIFSFGLFVVIIYIYCTSKKWLPLLSLTGVTLMLGATVMVSEASWWARLAPQIWLLSIIPSSFAVYELRVVGSVQPFRPLFNSLNLLFIAAMLVNVSLVAGPSLWVNVRQTQQVYLMMSRLEKVPKTDLRIDTLGLDSMKRRLQEAEVDYTAAYLDPETYEKVYGSFLRIDCPQSFTR